MRWLLMWILAAVFACAASGQDAPDSEPSAATVTGESETSPDAQIDDFFDRYLWIVPETTGHKASLGIGLFVSIALVIMMSARLANLDGVSFGRGSICSAVVLVAASLQIALVPASPVFVALACFVNVFAWFGLVRGVLGGDFYNGIVMLVASSFAVMLGLLGLQIAGTLLQRSALMA